MDNNDSNFDIPHDFTIESHNLYLMKCIIESLLKNFSFQQYEKSFSKIEYILKNIPIDALKYNHYDLFSQFYGNIQDAICISMWKFISKKTFGSITQLDIRLVQMLKSLTSMLQDRNIYNCTQFATLEGFGSMMTNDIKFAKIVTRDEIIFASEQLDKLTLLLV